MAAAKNRKLDDVLVWRYDGTGRPALCPLDPGTGQYYEGISEYGYDFIRSGAPILSGEYRYHHSDW